ncbi:Crp/Fnr family transcriptional regulator [Brevundimonas sp.]|uniref:Crp/Fnr family transcriptional regulator n=1 Tax=Brevundimonas sp. TaxID=1871086 RepID=UPI0035B2196D
MAELSSNRLLDALPEEDRAAVLGFCTRRSMAVDDEFCAPDRTISAVHFVLEGIISAVSEMRDGRSVEVFMVGREGAAGVEAALIPARAATRMTCQVDGSCLSIEAARMRELTAARPALREVLLRFQTGLQHELERSAACHALHRADQKLAKWLLRCHDRVGRDVLPLTQEYLAAMLGSQRTTVNEGAQALVGRKAIQYARGRITVVDRAALERSACECYRAPVGSDLPDDRV